MSDLPKAAAVGQAYASYEYCRMGLGKSRTKMETTEEVLYDMRLLYEMNPRRCYDSGEDSSTRSHCRYLGKLRRAEYRLRYT